MAKEEIYTCDIQNCGSKVMVKLRKLPIIMETDDNEGRACEPYLVNYEFDICEQHYTRMLDERKFISAYGAMGNNTYYFK